MLTEERLKEVLSYNAMDSGIFTWKIAKARSIKVGDIAGADDGAGYIQIQIDGTLYKAHRLAWLYVYGKFPIYIYIYIH